MVILLFGGENCQWIQRIHPERIHRERIKRVRWGKILTLQRIKVVSEFWILRSERGSDTSRVKSCRGRIYATRHRAG